MSLTPEEANAKIERLRVLLQSTLDAITRARCEPTPELTAVYEQARRELEENKDCARERDAWQARIANSVRRL